MNARRIEITVSQETWDKLEAVRGLVPRAAFVKAALERALPSASRMLEEQAAEEAMRELSGRKAAPVAVAGVKTARELAAERQARLNAGRGKP